MNAENIIINADKSINIEAKFISENKANNADNATNSTNQSKGDSRKNSFESYNNINININNDNQENLSSANKKLSELNINGQKSEKPNSKGSSENSSHKSSYSEAGGTSQLNPSQIINTLQLKIQILANAVKDERSKNSDLENQVKNLKTTSAHYEKILIEKEDMIVLLTREKYEFQTKYEKEKQMNENLSVNNSFTNFIGNIFNRRESQSDNNGTNDSEFRKLLKENVDLAHDYELLKKRYEETTQDFSRCKTEYQNIINSQIEKIKRLDNILQERNLSLDEAQKKLQIMFETHKKYDVEKTKYESSLNELKKDNKLREEKIIELLHKLEDKENLIHSYRESLQRHEIESAELAKKLAELKNAIIESNLVITSFSGERVGLFFNDNIELTFGRTEDNEYVMIIKGKNGEEYIDLEDIDHIRLSEKRPDGVDICYIVI